MMAERVYLDHNATSPLREEAREAMLHASELIGNPSSVHHEGRQARACVEAARDHVAHLVGADPEQVVFTSGATEANNWVMQWRDVAIVSAVEHASVLDAAAHFANTVVEVPVLANGIIDLEALERALSETQREQDQSLLVSVQSANSETGVVQPIGQVAELGHRHGALVHCDAVQSAGKTPLSFRELDVDFMSVSAHKLGGPKGVGALVSKQGAAIEPLFVGGGQEARKRAGTENVQAIAGFGAAAKATYEGLKQFATLESVRDWLEQALLAQIPDAKVIGVEATRLANTTCLAIASRKAETTVIALDLAGLAISAGSACSSGKVARSHVLTAMGLDGDLADTAIRVSLGWNNSKEDAIRALAAFERAGLISDESAAAA
ncbi:MAG: cysteine desulfurase family protein [Hyphomicrobiaceae bacterium]